jgi:hypothetical protein
MLHWRMRFRLEPRNHLRCNGIACAPLDTKLESMLPNECNDRTSGSRKASGRVKR